MTLLRRWIFRRLDRPTFRDLESRMRLGIQAGGKETQSGDGGTKVFTIAHGLGYTPTLVEVTAADADARGDFHVTADATNLTITYQTAPVSGTDNIAWWWLAGDHGA